MSILQPVNMQLCLPLPPSGRPLPWPGGGVWGHRCQETRHVSVPLRRSSERLLQGRKKEKRKNRDTVTLSYHGPHSQLLTRLCITINKARPLPDTGMSAERVLGDRWRMDQGFWAMSDPLYPVLKTRQKKRKVLSDTTVWLCQKKPPPASQWILHIPYLLFFCLWVYTLQIPTGLHATVESVHRSKQSRTL